MGGGVSNCISIIYILSVVVCSFANNLSAQPFPLTQDQHQVYVLDAENGTNPLNIYCVNQPISFAFTFYDPSRYASSAPQLGNTRRIRWFISGPNGTIPIAEPGFNSQYPLIYSFPTPGEYVVNFGEDIYDAANQTWTIATEPFYLGTTVTISPEYPAFEISSSNLTPCFGETIDIQSNFIPQQGIQPSSICWSYNAAIPINNWPTSTACTGIFNNQPLSLNGLVLTDMIPYTINVNLFNGCTASKTITISPVEPEFEIKPTYLCNFQVQYQANILNCGEVEYEYQWTFPGGTPSTSNLPNPVVSYPNGNQRMALLSIVDPLFSNVFGPSSVMVWPVFSAPDYTAPSLAINGVFAPELALECSANNLFSISNAADYPGYTFSLSAIENGTFIAGGGTSWVVQWDQNPNTISSFVITATSPEGCVSTHSFEFQPCCTGPNSLTLNGGNISDWLLANNFNNGIVNLNNTILFINGTVTVNTNTTFLACQNILLGTNAILQLQNGITLNIQQSNLRACGNNLWDGIYVSGITQQINVSNSSFSDAKCAIRIEKNALFDISNSNFYNNWVGIGFITMTQQNSLIRKCLFKSTDVMKRALGTNDLLFSIPYQAHFSSRHKGTGIYLLQCRLFTIGDDSNIQMRNEFNDLNYGLYANSSSIICYNNKFINMNTNFAHGTLPFISQVYFGTAIYARAQDNSPRFIQIGDLGNNQGNELTNCAVGLYALQSVRGNVVNNVFSSNSLRGIWWTLSRKSNNNITNNILNAQGGAGIELNNNPGTQFNVAENKITCTQNASMFVQTVGIAVDATAANALDQQYTIYRNEINNATIGIRVFNCLWPKIVENNVSCYPATLVPQNQNNFEIAGIQVGASRQPAIMDNLVKGNDALNHRVKGIDVQHCRAPFLSCDTVVNSGWAYAFMGANTNAFITRCSAANSAVGYAYYNGGFTGPQGAPGMVNGNKWWNISQAHTLATFLAGGPPTNGTLSPWYLPLLNPNISENPNPVMVNAAPPFSAPISNFQNAFYTHFNQPCQEIAYPAFREQQEKDWLKKVADDMPFILQQDEDTRYWMEEQAFDCLKLKPELMEDEPELIAFYQEKENGNSGKFQAIADSISLKGILNEDEKDALENLRSSILPERLQEANLKTVMEIYLRTYAKGQDSLHAEDESVLHQLAATCYFQGGQAVLIARSMLNSRPHQLPVQYADSCQSLYGLQRQGIIQEAESNKSIHIFPSLLEKGQSLQVTNAEGAWLRISDLTGKMLLERRVAQEHESVSLNAQITSGLYIVQVFDTFGKTHSQKIIVQ
ncbi:MAG: hypothetical protein ACK4GL_01855 [Flavobacteriales bacterium]